MSDIVRNLKFVNSAGAIVNKQIGTDETKILVDNGTKTLQQKLVELSQSGSSGGQGVPVGGLNNQILKKKSNSDFDTIWSPLNVNRDNLDFITWEGGGAPTSHQDNALANHTTSDLYMNHGYSAEGIPIAANGFICTEIKLPDNYIDITLLGGPAFNSLRFTIVFFDKDMKYITWLEWQTFNYPVTKSLIPDGTQYLGVTWQAEKGTNVVYDIQYTLPAPKYPKDTEIRVLAENVIGLPSCDCDGSATPSVSKYKGKKMAVLGDSLTQAEGYIAWHSHVKDALELATVYNYGLGWSIVGENTTPYFNPSTVVGDERRPMVRRASDMPNDADIIVVLPGTGEMVWDLPLGTLNDALTDGNGLSLTFYSGLKRLANILCNKYLYSKIIYITTMQQTSKLGDKQRQAVREVAELYGITVCDVSKARLNFNTMSSAARSLVTPDGIHMTNEGHRRLGETVTNTILYE